MHNICLSYEVILIALLLIFIGFFVISFICYSVGFDRCNNLWNDEIDKGLITHNGKFYRPVEQKFVDK